MYDDDSAFFSLFLIPDAETEGGGTALRVFYIHTSRLSSKVE